MSKDNFKIFNFLILCIVLLGLASAVQNAPRMLIKIKRKTPPAPPAPPRLTYVPQFVLISFDGSRAIDIWKMLAEFKDEMKAQGIHLNYTHFINAAYFLTEDNRNIYQPPGEPQGFTNIGVSEDLDHVRQRILEVNKAVADGDEIAVHTVGHLSGRYWSMDDWLKELGQFNNIMYGLPQLYSNDNMPALNLKPSDVVGFRAPYLDHDKSLYVALHSLKPEFRYDSSEVGTNDWPTRDEKGLWHIPLGTMERNGRSVLAMDYNWYVQDSYTKDVIKKGTDEWQKVYDETLAGLRRYFEENYKNGRVPVLVGYHFQTWNDGVYWEVLKTFARETCGKPEVRCGTFKELADYLDDYGVPVQNSKSANALHSVPKNAMGHENDHNE